MADTLTTRGFDYYLPLDNRMAFLLPAIRGLEKLLRSGRTELSIGLFAVEPMLKTDICLMLYDMLMSRPKNVRLKTVAMTAMLESNLLIWLAGDVRVLRTDTWVMWTPPMVQEREKIRSPYSRVTGRDAFAVEDARICELITRHLPGTLAGRMLFCSELSEWIDVQTTRADFFAGAYKKNHKDAKKSFHDMQNQESETDEYLE